MVHFVIIISIFKVFQVQNKPMGFLPPIQMKGLITMKLIHARYNPMHNSIDINHYNGYILRIDCNQAESRIWTTPNSQRRLNVLAIDEPLEYARLALDGEMQAWVDADDSLEPFKHIASYSCKRMAHTSHPLCLLYPIPTSISYTPFHNYQCMLKIFPPTPLFSLFN